MRNLFTVFIVAVALVSVFVIFTEEPSQVAPIERLLR